MTEDRIHVLLIEDNPGDASLVQGMLEHDERSAFTVKHVSTLEEGMRSLAPGSGNQVILLDLGLPDATGLDTSCLSGCFSKPQAFEAWIQGWRNIWCFAETSG